MSRKNTCYAPPDGFFTGEPSARRAARILERIVERQQTEDAHQRSEERFGLLVDGARFWAHVVITALYDADNRPRGFAKITRDDTERRRADRNREKLIRELYEALAKLKTLSGLRARAPR